MPGERIAAMTRWRLPAAAPSAIRSSGQDEGPDIPSGDATNSKNLYLLVQLRWLAVGGQVVTMLLVERWLGVSLPLAPMGAVVAFLVCLNLVALWRLQQPSPVTNTELFLELLLDLAALTVQLYLSGGATNPFISLYLLQIVLGAVLLQAWSTWVLVGLAVGCFAGLSSFHRVLELPHGHGEGLFGLHIRGMFVCFVIASGLLALFISRIGANLRERDARLADLRQRSSEEDHIVRMGLLASGAAHELGTPLATMSVILNDWRRLPAFRDDPELAEEVAEMQAQLDRCKTIVSAILLSAGEARGEGTLRTSVRILLDDVVAEWRLSRQPARLDYRNDFAPDAPIVSDAALKQLIFNLFDNALEASPHRFEVTARRDADRLVVVVSDTGPGFDPDILAAFGKPYRSTKGRPGSGLGLFLVVNVVRKLGGTVAARNDPGAGARVTLTLPLASLAPGEANGR